METKKKLTRQQNVIAMAQKLGVAGRHAGSKPVRRLLNGIRSVQESARISQVVAKQRAERGPKAPETLTNTNSAENVDATVVQQ